MSGVITFRVVLRVDDGSERHEQTRAWCDPVPPGEHPVSLVRSVAGSLGELTDERATDEVAASVEQWCRGNGVDLVDPPEGGRFTALELQGQGGLRFYGIGSLRRGKRLAEELPPVPPRESLSKVGAEAQSALLQRVGEAGGREGLGGIPVDPANPSIFVPLLEEWAECYGQTTSYGLRFNARGCGTWYCLDRLVPLQDPHRWEALRNAVLAELESNHGWRRINPPRGSVWEINRPGGTDAE